MAHIRFTLSGPFRVPYKKDPASRCKQILSEHAKLFWQDECVIPFADKQGCYIFALRNGQWHTPWYVGKAGKALRTETFTPDKLLKFNRVIFEKKGTPIMFFVTRTDGRNNFPATVLYQLEKFLIQAAKFKNPELINKIHTKNLDDWSIDDVYRFRNAAQPAILAIYSKK